MTINELYKRYPYIVAWGKMVGSYGYYIKEQCERAYDRKIDPSTNPVFYKDIGQEWACLNDLSDSLQAELIERVKNQEENA